MSDAPERIWFTAVDQNIVPNSCRRTPEDQEYVRADLCEAKAARIEKLEKAMRDFVRVVEQKNKAFWVPDSVLDALSIGSAVEGESK